MLRGKPEEQIPAFAAKLRASTVTFESDIEPYARVRDAKLVRLLESQGVTVSTFSTHTLRDPSEYLAAGLGKIPTTFRGFVKLFESLGNPRRPAAPPTRDTMRPLPVGIDPSAYHVPALAEMGYTEAPTDVFPGGEREGLKRLANKLTQHKAQLSTLLDPPSSVLSPYMKFGCVSAAKLYHDAAAYYKSHPTGPSPQPLHRQLLWREWFYANAGNESNYDQQIGNPRVKDIPWERDVAKIQLWKDGKTGFPLIDAAMRQLKKEGFIHNVPRQAAACFLTRGDLYQHWQEGAKIFDQLLVDADWAVNVGNWLWMSASRFYYQWSVEVSPC